MLNKDVVFLRNERAWKRWANGLAPEPKSRRVLYSLWECGPETRVWVRKQRTSQSTGVIE